ncbi:MAG: 50S ribosomal protein L3 [Leptospiraceae bacterium]|nr:50S ribosomal protein L3 [Leptospiraceae bacterium]
MTKGLIGKKLGMSHIYADNGNMIPVTVIEVGPCFVSQVKTVETDGYSAVQLAFGNTRETQLTKPEVSHLAKNNISPKRYLKEFELTGDAPSAGSEIKIADIFKDNDVVKVTGISKGKGFQGVVKRHGHAGGPAGHGSRFHRHPGSMGANSTPSRVFKGVKLPGRTGSLKTSIKNLKVVKVYEDKNIILVSGSVPGPEKSIITIEKL